MRQRSIYFPGIELLKYAFIMRFYIIIYILKSTIVENFSVHRLWKFHFSTQEESLRPAGSYQLQHIRKLSGYACCNTTSRLPW